MAAASAPPRVGFLGAGLIATFHSKMLRASGADHERAGVYDPDRDRAERFVARAGGRVVDGVDEVLASCDAVYVCTWTAAHEELVARACDAGRAVFVEKPSAPTSGWPGAWPHGWRARASPTRSA